MSVLRVLCVPLVASSLIAGVLALGACASDPGGAPAGPDGDAVVEAPDSVTGGDDVGPGETVCAADSECAGLAGGPCEVATCDAGSGLCVVGFASVGAKCDDDDPCTAGEACAADGACSGGVAKDCDDQDPCTEDACGADGECEHVGLRGGCPCAEDEDCAAREDGDACNGTLVCAAGECVVDPDSVVVCDASGDGPCESTACDPASGACQVVAESDGSDCDDEDPCTEDVCQGGVCTGTPVDCGDEDLCTDDACDPATGCAHSPATCGDGDPCTDDACEPEVGCTHLPVAGCAGCTSAESCDDGDACTIDACGDDAVCNHAPLDCDDGDACTEDACDPTSGCTTTAVVCDDGDACTADGCDPATGCTMTAMVCDDGDACTDDACDSTSGCTTTAVICDDGDACTDDACDPATGCATTAVVCDDADACTDDSCDPTSGCTTAPTACDDADACTDDTCDPALGCGHELVVCDDGDACTEDLCKAAEGCVVLPSSCGDGDPCTADGCDPDTGCTHVAEPDCLGCQSDGQCDDGDACTDDACEEGGTCSHAPVACADEDVCTDDACDPVEGCVFMGVICDDEDACTDDACDPATGCTTAAVVCDDEDACTDDACDPATGCTTAAVVCDDGDACTDDACDPATGCTTAAVVCDDGDACTDDACDPATGCTTTVAVCDDEDACTEDACDPATGCMATALVCDDEDACSEDACDPATGCTTTALVCDDGDACTDDWCDPATGCGATSVVCDDDDACTDDSCDPVTGCAHADAPCGDGDPCTLDACDPEAGCSHEPIAGCFGCEVDGDCDDGDACTDDACQANGTCAHAVVTCDDGDDLCTTDSCDPAVGCVFAPTVCDDGDACTVDGCDPATGCTANAVTCDDEDACTVDGCDPATGCTASAVVCDDEDACTVDGCDPATGCTATSVVCDDEDACTADDCDPATGCTATPTSSYADPWSSEVFELGGPCTYGTCGFGEVVCGPTGVAVCTAADLAIDEVCDGADNDCDGVTDEEDADQCQTYWLDWDGDEQGGWDAPSKCLCEADLASYYTGLNDWDCADWDPYTWTGAPELCDYADNNCNGPYDEDFQSGGSSPYYDPNTGTGPLWLGDACGVGACAGGYVDCGGDPYSSTCSTLHLTSPETCDGADNDCDGLTDDELGSECDDGDPCTTDTCGGNAGCLHTSCDDGDPCTEDACVADVGCDFAPIAGCAGCGTAAECDDQDACTDDTCEAGVCAHAAVVCEDSVACTNDACDPAVGCVAPPDDDACSDGVACTIDVCDEVDGCVHTSTDALCDDDVPCTTDTCGGAAGCGHVTVDSACDDQVACTVDTCEADAGCLSAPDDALCDDGDPCTADVCDPTLGPAGACTHTPTPGGCDDGNPCTGGDTCVDGLCAGEPLSGTSCLEGGGACEQGICCPASTVLTPRGCELPGKNMVFVTGASWTGDLGGLTGADDLCNGAAAAANLAGTWRAWLSTDTVDARDRVGDAPYYLVTDEQICASRADLIDGTLGTHLDRTELGADVAVNVWTNTKFNGVNNTAWGNCNNWENTGGGKSGYGASKGLNGGQWTWNDGMYCGAGQNHLYCFEEHCPGQPYVDFLGDSNHCGSCGHVCPGTTECQDGQCILPGQRMAFVTSAVFDGGLANAVSDGGSGGLEAADARCAERAAATHLGGTWRAWLGDDNTDAGARIGAQGFHRLDGALIAADGADLRDGTLANPISLDESATALGPGERAWTGALADGGSAGAATCLDWGTAAAGAQGTTGLSAATDSSWTAAETRPCAEAHHLYCLEDECPGTPVADTKQHCGACGVACPGATECIAGECQHPSSAMVFVTSASYIGGYSDGVLIGGLAGADAKCQALAEGANLYGQWHAWLSDGSTDARDRVANQVYRRIDGPKVADGKADLTGCTGAGPCLDAPIDHDQHGQYVSGYAWTGTQANGTAEPDLFCKGWNQTVSSGHGTMGSTTSKTATWTDALASGEYWCWTPLHLYCFQDELAWCAGAPVPAGDYLCDDGDACTTDTCDPVEGCLHLPVACDDSEACTVDLCDPDVGCYAALAEPWVDPHGGATYTEHGAPCGTGACAGGAIVCDGAEPVCSTVANAAAESCDGGDEDCDGAVDEDTTGVGEHCDDSDACTTDTCDGAAGCVHAPCDDGDPCTNDLCLPGFGCQAVTIPGCVSCDTMADCDDVDACTDDTCEAGICVHATVACDDGVDCTTDGCDPATGCVGTPVDAACGDDVGCTVDTCDADAGCAHTPSDALCADAHACTTDTCDAQAGCAHAAVDGACDDGIDCTADSCDAQAGCVFDAQAALCDDDSPCTQDVCDPAQGPPDACVYLPAPGSCDDSDPCTEGDTCAGGVCQGAPTSGAACFGGGGSCQAGVCCPAATVLTQRGCEIPYKNMVFVTGAAWYGALGGLEGADEKCNAAAGAANLSGTWRAWLSTDTVHAKDRVGDLPYYVLTGEAINTSLADLLDGQLATAIDTTELGGQLVANVWTNTKTFGTNNTAWGNCNNWTNTSGAKSGYGNSGSWGNSWTFTFGMYCGSGQNHLYCFQEHCPDQPYVDFANDSDNCGSCGYVCPGATTCQGGQCVLAGLHAAFVTSSTHSGDFGGFEEADAICAARADDANLGKTWTAWLSDGVTSAAERIGAQGFYRMDGALIAADKADLLDGSLDNPISLDETAQPVGLLGGSVWTGAMSSGAPSDANCQGWTSSSFLDQGAYGSVLATGPTWSSTKGGAACSGQQHLYCLQDECPGTPVANTKEHCGACGVACPGAAECIDDTCMHPDGALVFVTSGSWVGGYSGVLVGGLAGADAKCQTAALNANLSGQWRAWLSDGSTDARDRVLDQAYYRVDGPQVASGIADLTGCTGDGPCLTAPIDHDENGQYVNGYAWTGTLPDGTAEVDLFCKGWNQTSASGHGTAGSTAATDGQWTDHSGTWEIWCYETRRLYCFQETP